MPRSPSASAASRGAALAVVSLGLVLGCGPSGRQPARQPDAPSAPAAGHSAAANPLPPGSHPPGEVTPPEPSLSVPALASASGPVASEPAPAPVPPTQPAGGVPMTILGTEIPPGTSTRLMWSPTRIFEGITSETPVLVVNGSSPGPVLCLAAAVHGDELNGIEMVRRVFQDLSPESLAGAAIGIPIVNIHGFRRGSRYLPDRRDLNRFFPGNPQGSSAARIAHSLFEDIIRQCSAVVDLHTGSYFRSNLPQVRADLSLEPVAALAQGFGGMLVLNSKPRAGTLRRAATDAGIPTVLLEAGEPLRLQRRQVEQGVAGLNRLMRSLGMTHKATFLRQPEPVYYRSKWVRSDHGGVLFSVVRLGQTVRAGDILGNVTDPITNEQNLIYAPVEGRIIGMAVNQVVMPGFAAFHLGTEAREGEPGAAADEGTESNGKGPAVATTDRNGDEASRDTE